jgi:hypothetical protein
LSDQLCDFLGQIDHSKSFLQILWLLLKNTHLETKHSNKRKPESEWVRKNLGFPSLQLFESGGRGGVEVMQVHFNIEAKKLPFFDRRSLSLTTGVAKVDLRSAEDTNGLTIKSHRKHDRFCVNGTD